MRDLVHKGLKLSCHFLLHTGGQAQGGLFQGKTFAIFGFDEEEHPQLVEILENHSGKK